MNDFGDLFPLLAGFEPVTSFTDLLVSFSGLYFYNILKKEYLRDISIFWWKYFFLFMGLSTFFGTLSHIMEHQGYQKVYVLLWNCMQVLAGFAMFYAQRAAVLEISGKMTSRIFLFLANLQFMIFVPTVLYFQDFRVVAFNSLLVIIQMMVLFFPRHFSIKYSHTKIWLGFFISVLTVFIHQQKLGFSRWFNHKDVSHVLMVLSLWLIFKGVQWRTRNSESFAIA